MSDFTSRLAVSSSASERMDALCDFIEFRLGHRRDEYGVRSHEVGSRLLPMPLRRLYEFAGRWPGFHQDSPWAVGAFSCQDSLTPFHQLPSPENGRIAFLEENQACWICSTQVDGEDPPVWCVGDFWHEGEETQENERAVCDSLSRFLVTFVLQEITLGSRCCIWDETLKLRFEDEQADAALVWDQGPYVYGSDSRFWLWNDVMVAELWGSVYFGASHPDGIQFLDPYRPASR